MASLLNKFGALVLIAMALTPQRTLSVWKSLVLSYTDSLIFELSCYMKSMAYSANPYAWFESAASVVYPNLLIVFDKRRLLLYLAKILLNIS
jgi:hypothetical protein